MSRDFEVIMPQLGVNDEEVAIVEWRCRPGDRVERGQVLATVETGKATFELECEQSGFFYPAVESGARVSIREVVAIVLPERNPDVVREHLAKREVGLEKVPAAWAATDGPGTRPGRETQHRYRTVAARPGHSRTGCFDAPP